MWPSFTRLPFWIHPMAVHDWIAWLKSHLLCMICKYFLSVRTGIGAHQVDLSDFNRAQPFRYCIEFLVLDVSSCIALKMVWAVCPTMRKFSLKWTDVEGPYWCYRGPRSTDLAVKVHTDRATDRWTNKQTHGTNNTSSANSGGSKALPLTHPSIQILMFKSLGVCTENGMSLRNLQVGSHQCQIFDKSAIYKPFPKYRYCTCCLLVHSTKSRGTFRLLFSPAELGTRTGESPRPWGRGLGSGLLMRPRTEILQSPHHEAWGYLKVLMRTLWGHMRPNIYQHFKAFWTVFMVRPRHEAP